MWMDAFVNWPSDLLISVIATVIFLIVFFIGYYFAKKYFDKLYGYDDFVHQTKKTMNNDVHQKNAH